MTPSPFRKVWCLRTLNRSIFNSPGKYGILAATMLFTGFSTGARAGLVQNLHEEQLDAIFSQASFGANTIDIRFNPSQTLYNSDWLINDSTSGVNGYVDDGDLAYMTRASGLSRSLSVPMFYVDDYRVDDVSSNTIGLAWIGYNGFSLKTSFQADRTLKPETHLPCPPEYGPGCYTIDPAVTEADIERYKWVSAEVVAHELGHNLGLWHSYSGLMAPSIDPTTMPDYTLASDQVATILSSRFVQMDANQQRFISITPFAVLASVPLPTAWLMFGSGLGMLAWRSRVRLCLAA